ncbi:MAG: branched-chain amino acid ABC transporter substrate-binding protein [Dongiaceae bacterium]
MRKVSLSLVAAAALAAAIGTGAAKAEDEISIGVAGPMTGQYAAFGEQLRRGAEMAVKNINAGGGVLGKKLVLRVGDDACDPKQAVAVANNLVKSGVVFVAGHFCSGSSIPASSVYAEEGILQISPASTNPKFTDDAAAKGIKTVMRTCGRDDQQGVFAGTWLASTFAGKNIAVLDDKSAYGKGLADETRKNMNAHGLKEVMDEQYTAGDKDFSALISKMKAAKIDVIYVGGYHPDAALIVRQAREQGLNASLVSGDALNTAEFWTISGPAGQGVRFSDASSAIDLPSAAKVVEQFRADKYEPEGYTLSTYAAIEAWAAAANEIKSTDGEKVAEHLRQHGESTIIGQLNWDAKGDLTKSTYAWFVWNDGKYKQEK